jgi:casein kinase II subunit beta
MLFAVHPEFRPQQMDQKYEPRIYGFRLHETAYEEMAKRREEERLIESQTTVPRPQPQPQRKPTD